MSVITPTAAPTAILSDGYYAVTMTLRHSGGEEFDVKTLLYVSNEDGLTLAYSVGVGGDLRKKIGTMRRSADGTLSLVNNNGTVEEIKSCVAQVVKPMAEEDREYFYQRVQSRRARGDAPGFQGKNTSLKSARGNSSQSFTF